ncbi:hypothetical protein [Hoeflea halophila]|uniref:hypothetical protein n=1 Tax=Hoeflea halophila TaxID=714899 RepID=UPI0015CCC3FD|nr:hypothetical protein [Hoeflea halophila]
MSTCAGAGWVPNRIVIGTSSASGNAVEVNDENLVRIDVETIAGKPISLHFI